MSRCQNNMWSYMSTCGLIHFVHGRHHHHFFKKLLVLTMILVQHKNCSSDLKKQSHTDQECQQILKQQEKIEKLSRQIDADGTAIHRAFMAGGLGAAQGPQKLWDKWCKILHSRPLLALNFIIEASFFCTIFLIFCFTFCLHFSNYLHHCLFFAF